MQIGSRTLTQIKFQTVGRRDVRFENNLPQNIGVFYFVTYIQKYDKDWTLKKSMRIQAIPFGVTMC